MTVIPTTNTIVDIDDDWLDVRGTVIAKQRRMFYNGDKKIKSTGVRVKYTPEQLRELNKCKDDYIHFIRNYIYTVTPDDGLIKLDLFDYQADFIHTVHKNRYTITKSPRQTGKSISLAAYVIHYALFNPHKNVLLLANKGAKAREFMSRVQKAYVELPFWLQQGVTEWNKSTMVLENGCKIFADATTASAGRGETISFIILDEMAFIPQNLAEEMFKSIIPTLSSGKSTKIAIISAPKGMNYFYKIWTEANDKDSDSDYVPYEWRWNDFPAYGEEFKKSTIGKIGIDAWMQEFECEFMGSATGLISSPVLKSIPLRTPKRNVVSFPGVQIYDYPVVDTATYIQIREDQQSMYTSGDAFHKYSVHVDCAHGKLQDYSTCVVMDITDPQKFVQVAVFRSNEINPLHFPWEIQRLAKYYNNAMVLIEINDIGYDISNTLYWTCEYENVLCTKTDNKKTKNSLKLCMGGNGVDRGLKMTAKVKRIGCSYLKTLIESGRLVIQNYETVQELSTFNKQKTSYASDEGSHDDLVMPLVAFSWMVTQEFFDTLTDNSNLKRSYKSIVDDLRESEFMPSVIVDDHTESSMYDVFSGIGFPDDEDEMDRAFLNQPISSFAHK